MRNGCLVRQLHGRGVRSQREIIRHRLVEIFAEVQASLAYCLQAAVDAGELPPGFDCAETAGFIVSSLQGAILLAKAQRSPAPVERFKQILFATVLR